MPRFQRIAVVALLPLLLAACAALIPDQSVDNLFGFNGYTVDLDVSPVAPGVIAAQAAEIVAAGSVEQVVDDDVLSDLPFDPTNVSESIGAQWIRLFAPPAGLVGTQAITDELPETLSLDQVTFAINFTDGVTDFDKNVSATFSPAAVFQRDDSSCNQNLQRCDYLPVGENAASLTIEIGSGEIATVLAILTSNDGPKIASGNAQLFFSDDPLLAGVSRAQMRLEAFGGVVGFR